MIPFPIAKIFTDLLRNRSEGSFYAPFFNVFVMLLLLLPAPQDNNKNKLTAGRVQSFTLLEKLPFRSLQDRFAPFSFVNFPPNFPLINRT